MYLTLSRSIDKEINFVFDEGLEYESTFFLNLYMPNLPACGGVLLAV